ncbi:MAG: hypothetical protein CMJ83_04020 [Planctomycetes bacterium]|nr:hypothetical protein [Planctomycetota bacterium]
MDVRMSLAILLAALGVVTVACRHTEPEPAHPEPPNLRQQRPEPELPLPPPRSGTFRALTYNIHGLPSRVARTSILRNVPLISPKLNAYDLALIQEDFVHHAELEKDANHPHRSRPMTHGKWRILNDGLNRFSRFPFGRLLRVKWNACHGLLKSASDCLARKGFSVATTTFAEGVKIDVYNLHAEAGGGEEDRDARRIGITQLGRFITEYSRGRAVIVAGDFNLHAFSPRDEALFRELLAATGLTDVARFLQTGHERIDRFLFRSGGGTRIVPESWEMDRTFIDDRGSRLSDHPAIAVTFRWTTE